MSPTVGLLSAWHVGKISREIAQRRHEVVPEHRRGK
jgi:hypothetical protein